MTSLEELCAVLDSIGIPWSNQRFDGSEPEPPYIVLVVGFTESAYADNLCYMKWMPYDVALYSRYRDYADERKIADALDAADIPHELAVTSIDNEKLIEAAFSVYVAEREKE